LSRLPRTDEDTSDVTPAPVAARPSAGGEDPGTAAAETAVERQARRPRQRTPRVVWWVIALHIAVLGAYSILLPTYRAPDEPLHVDLAHLWSTDFTYPEWDARDTGSDIIRSLDYVRFQGRAAHLTAAEATPKDERPSYEELEDPDGPRGRNQMPNHPPLYYVVAGTAERAAEAVIGEPDFQLETWFYRLVSIVFVASLPFVIWRTAKTLGVPDTVGVAAMLIPLAIPQYLHIGASVNNDSLQFLLIWLVTPIVLRLGRGELGTRTVALAGVISGLGLLTKGFAFVTLAWVGCALLLALLRAGRASVGPVARAGALYAIVTMALGGWWWVRNLILYGALMPSRYSEIVGEGPGPGKDVGGFLRGWAELTVRRFWGDFGYYDTHIPTLAITVATVLCVAAIVVACVGRDPIARTRAGDRLLLLLALLLLMAMQLRTSLGGYLDSGLTAGLQGRYWYGSLAAVPVLIALGCAKLLRRHTHWLPVIVLPAIAIMQGVALSTILGFYWGAPHSALTSRLRAIVAWAPVPGELIAVAAMAGVVVFAVTATELGRFVRREGQGPNLALEFEPWSSESALGHDELVHPGKKAAVDSEL
jgi:small subunit ribosomal protein S36